MNKIDEKTADITRAAIICSPNVSIRDMEQSLGISSGWVSKFVNGKISSPGFDRIVKIYNYMIENHVESIENANQNILV